MIHRIPAEYRLPLWGGMEPELRRSFKVSSALGALVVLLVFLTPVRKQQVVEVSQVPERFARLILEKPKPPARSVHPERPAGAAVESAEPAPVAPTPPVARPPARRQAAPSPTPGTGETGRKLAQEQVATSLRGATRAADDAVQNLTAVLGTKPGSGESRPNRRRKSVGQARGTSDLAAVEGGPGGASGGADIASSGVQSAGIQIEQVSWTAGGDGGTGGGAGGGAADGSAGGSAAISERTQASLLAVVRRYAPGIQYCYDNELKHSPGLRGKLVAAITVTPAGQVQNARIVANSLGSESLASCVTSQIRDWKFPAVPEGTVTFDAPFVFTPPRD